ncbi:MAG: filamentous hemagglutinin N-terminal domain-containing protein [Janthinobacterium lividum]
MYRLIWSKLANAWIAVAECTRTRTRGSRAGAASLSVALSITTAMSMPAAIAAPDGGVVTAGSGSISQAGNVTTISQASKNLSLNWNGFNVGSGETVNFIQPSANALAINRITGGSASQILGQVNANGQLFLINPGGILFGQSAQVNVGGLVASTLDLAGEGDGSTRRFSGSGRGSIINQGALRAAYGGYISLLGNQVINQGIVTARMGTVAMAGGSAMTLTFNDNSLVNVQVNQSTFDTLVANQGIVIADGGLAIMTAGTRDSLLENLTSNSGVIEAHSAENRNGKIVLSSAGPKGKTTVSGTLDASNASGTGGTIAVGGTAIELAGARLDASGSAGGGGITIGGGFQGQAVAGATTAETVSIDKASTILAQATDSGNGGEVTVWSNRSTRFEGSIDAQATGNGGSGGSGKAGAGGNAEVSSAGQLGYDGTTTLLSSRGATGNLLLDPYDITISTAAASNVDASSTATGNSSNINNTTLQTALGSANVTVSTGASGSQSGNITVLAPIIWSAAYTLTLNAAGAIAINAPIVAKSASSGLTLTAGASKPISVTDAIWVGKFTLTQGDFAQNAAVLPTFIASNSFTLTGGTFLRAAGGDGSAATPYLLTDIYGMRASAHRLPI